MKPLSFIIIGSGWRSLFFARIAKQFPEQFELKYMLCRTEEKARKMQEEYGVPATTSEALCEEAKPDFVVISIRVPDSFAEIKKWSGKGYPILTETPAGGTVEHLKELWNMVQNGAKIQVAEQYHRYPFLAAGLQALKEGKIGDPHMVYLSLAHNHHGASLVRCMLQPDNSAGLRMQSISGKSYKHTVTETDSRYGAITDGRVKEFDRMVCTMEFTNGKTAVYDFSGLQYHSFIRTRHLSVKGPRGEWNDTVIRYLDPNNQSVTQEIKTRLNFKYSCLETKELQEQSKAWNPFIEMDAGQDEYAIATMMFDMREYIEKGVEVYPMAEALEDAYVTILFQQVAKNPGVQIIPEEMPWHK